MEEELGADGVGDKGERCRGGTHQAEVGPGEANEVAEEGDGHEEDSAKEGCAGEDAGDDREEAVVAAELAEVANAAHGQGDENVSGGGGADGDEDAESRCRGSSYPLLDGFGLGGGSGWMLGAGWASGDEADTNGDERDARPALRD